MEGKAEENKSGDSPLKSVTLYDTEDQSALYKYDTSSFSW